MPLDQRKAHVTLANNFCCKGLGMNMQSIAALPFQTKYVLDYTAFVAKVPMGKRK